MKILLDECVDQRLRQELPGHEIATVQELGWAGKKNGELLRFAQETFQVFITVDRNLHFQQNLSKFRMAILILTAKTNEVADLRPLAPAILDRLGRIEESEVWIIGETQRKIR